MKSIFLIREARMKKLIFICLFFMLFTTGCKTKEFMITINNGEERINLNFEKEIFIKDLDKYQKEGFTFKGFSLEENGAILDDEYLLSSDLTLYTVFEKEINVYTITFVYNNGMDNEVITVKEGTELSLPVDPTLENKQFEGWYKDIECIYSFDFSTKIFRDYTLYANYIDQTIFKISFILDGGILNEEIDSYNTQKSIRLPIPEKEGFFFQGYYLDSEFTSDQVYILDENYHSDLTLYAKYVDKTLENAKISILGDSISTFAGYINVNYSPYYPKYSSTVKNVADTWWMKTIIDNNMVFLQNSSYGGSTVIGSGSTVASSKERINNLSSSAKGAPNIVIIYIGINDFLGIYTEQTDLFKTTYINMVKNIKNLYNGVDIYLCNLPYEKYSKEKGESLPPRRQEFNTIIEEIAESFSVNLIDIKNVITINNADEYLGDRVHPNKKGMYAISDVVTKKLKEIYKGVTR